MKHQPSAPSDPDAVTLSDTGRSIFSLIIFIHVFLVALCLSANLSRSRLQARLLEVCAPHVQLLNLNPDFTPYHLTHGMIEDVDHRIEVLPDGADPADQSAWVVLPDAGWRGSDRYKRYQRLAKTLSVMADFDQQSADIARDIGEHFVHHGDFEPVQLRARRHTLQHWEVFTTGRPEDRNPNAAVYFQSPYDADLIVTDDGLVFPNKRSSVGETARVGQDGSN